MPSSAPSAAASDDYEFVCYGDRVCFLCDGQLLALAHKLNLSYQQMAMLALATAASGGLMGLAGFFVWRRGLFRKRYAALCSDDLYDDVDARGEDAVRTVGGVPIVGAPADGFGRKMRGSRTSTGRRDEDPVPSLNTADEEISLLADPSASGADPPAAHPHYSTRHQHEAVTFRLFAFDPETQQLDFAKVGMPVRFGAPVVVVHASSNRALRFQSRPRGGAVTLSRPPINLNFHKQVRACIEAAGSATAGPASVPSTANTAGSGPQAVDEVADAKQHAAMGGGPHQPHHKSRQEPRSTPLPSLAELSHYHQAASGPSNAPPTRPSRRSLDLSPYLALLDSDSSDANSLREQALSQGDDSFGPTAGAATAPTSTTTAASTHSSRGRGRADRSGGLWRQILLPNAPTTATAPTTRRRTPQSSSRFYRSISESYLSFVADLNESIARQRERRELRKRQRKLMKHLPNMSFAHPGGKLYVATLYPVKHHATGSNTHSLGSSSASNASTTTGSGSGSGHSLLGALPPEEDEFLRWGAPMGLLAAFNHQPCEVAPRGEYYKDSRLYLSTCGEASSHANAAHASSSHPTTTLIPLRECGDDLACLARESTRLLARAQRRRVTLRVGTYNVWMLPRKVSMFTAVSPRKNTRARLMAEVLPACDVWVFTECFDHRSRKVLLDKLAESGGYYFSTPTVGHNKRMSKGGKTYVRKLINGGVLIASKYPILSVRIKLFGDASCGADRLADKGVLYAKILKEGLLVHVFATHFQAWNDAASRAVRRTQMEMVKSFMASLAIDPENDAVLLVGDLNVDFWLNKRSGEYDEMLDLLDLHDTAAGSASRASGGPASAEDARCLLSAQRSAKFSFDRRLNALAADGLSSDGSLELLDYVLYSKSHRQPSQADSWVLPIRSATPWKWRKREQFNLSDHFPVVSELAFDM